MNYTIDEDGSVDLGYRTIPVPNTISVAAAEMLRGAAHRPPPADIPLWERRAEVDAVMAGLHDIAARMHPVDIEDVQIAGVHCHVVRRANPASESSRVLINLHAGGFVIGSGCLVEAIPVAALTGHTVIAVDYRLAPEHVFPAAVDDVVAVYMELLEHHSAAEVGIFGTSAGAYITAQTIVRLRSEGIPAPGCAGIFCGGGDLVDHGDTAAIFDMSGFAGERLHARGHAHSNVDRYLGDADPADPMVSPRLGDLTGFPPTLLISGTRDATLSSTAMMHRALRRADADAELYVFEAMAHGFFYALHLPETAEAHAVMAAFFRKHLGE